MKKIKVIEVSSDTNIGGAGKCLLTLLENFDYNTFDVKVVLPKNSLLKPHIDKMNIPVIEVDGIADKSLDFAAVKKLRMIFKRERPDIVHTHASMSARIAAKQAGAKVVYTRHSVFEPSKKISRGIGKVINGMINNHYADSIIAVAEAAKDNLTDTGVKESKIKVILNGVDGLTPVSTDEKRIIKERFNLPDGYKAVSIVARLEDIKGHDYFIEAADRLLQKGIKARFYIVGTGSYENHLKEKVKNNKNIIMTGFVQGEELDELYSNAYLYCLPSHIEGMPISLLEAMSYGCNILVSDIDENVQVTEKYGTKFETGNTKNLSQKLKEELDGKNRYEQNKIQEFVLNKYSWNDVVGKTMKIYEEI